MPGYTKELKSKGKKRKERQNKLMEKARRGELSQSPKQVRARARRYENMARDAMEVLYKPVADWDDEELARGRPRNKDGSFSGRGPEWVSREVHEEAVHRFVERTRGESRALVPLAIKTVEQILKADGVDKRGRALVPAGVRLDAAKWLIEHVIGKPTQRTEMDISVRLQAVLAGVMVNPMDAVSGVNGTEGLAGLMAGRNDEGGAINLADGVTYMPSMVRADMWEDGDDEASGDSDD